jgi:hypothetical protein
MARWRKLAAANLGRLKATEAADALVALVVRASTEPSGDEDAAAALLALGEIGDPAVLLRAAGATPAEGKKTAEALVWMFQTLSPTLQGGRAQDRDGRARPQVRPAATLRDPAPRRAR